MLIKLIRTLQARQLLVASSSQLYHFLAGVAAAIEFSEGDLRQGEVRRDPCQPKDAGSSAHRALPRIDPPQHPS